MPLQELLDFSWLADDSTAMADENLNIFARLIVTGTMEQLSTVDSAIGRHLEHWSIERLKKVDLAILRTAVYSLLFQSEIAAQITIDEAIEIAKEYGAEDSYKFINVVLDAVWKEAEATH